MFNRKQDVKYFARSTHGMLDPNAELSKEMFSSKFHQPEPAYNKACGRVFWRKDSVKRIWSLFLSRKRGGRVSHCSTQTMVDVQLGWDAGNSPAGSMVLSPAVGRCLTCCLTWTWDGDVVFGRKDGTEGGMGKNTHSHGSRWRMQKMMETS